MDSPRPTYRPSIDDAIEHGGIRWDPRTGLEVGVVYVEPHAFFFLLLTLLPQVPFFQSSTRLRDV